MIDDLLDDIGTKKGVEKEAQRPKTAANKQSSWYGGGGKDDLDLLEESDTAKGSFLKTNEPH